MAAYENFKFPSAEKPSPSSRQGDWNGFFAGREGQDEAGVTKRGVMNAIAAIKEHDLDLNSCVEKGGSWRVAALLIIGEEYGPGLSSGQLIDHALRDFSRDIDDNPVLSLLAHSDERMRNTIEAVRRVLKDPTRDIQRDCIVGPLYEALITDDLEGPDAGPEEPPTLRLSP